MKTIRYIFLTLAIIGTITVTVIILSCMLGGCQSKSWSDRYNCPCTITNKRETPRGKTVTLTEKDGKEHNILSKELYLRIDTIIE